MNIVPKLLPASIALALAFSANAVFAEEASESTEPDVILVLGERLPDPLLPNTMKSVEDGRLFTGKKSTVVELAGKPTFVEPNLRQIFSRLPGLFVSDQKTPSFYNVNYRGLGDPHETEFVAFFMDGVPLAADLFGYPTIYFLPPAQRIERVEFVRGGSGLLYGPQIGPSVNFVMRRADALADSHVRTEHSVGSHGFYSTYNEGRWGNGEFGLMLSFDHRQGDGPRRNEDFEVNSGFLGVDFAGIDGVRIGFDLSLYQSDSGEAGRLSTAEFNRDRSQTRWPNDRVEIDRVIAALTYDHQLRDNATLNAKLWYAYKDRFSRRSRGSLTQTSIDQQEFTVYGFDARLAQAWGHGHVLTMGTTLYQSDSPRSRHLNPDIRSDVQRPQDLMFLQDRKIRYGAVFAENLFRFGALSVAPALRYDRVNYDLFEPVMRADLARDPADVDQTESELLLGLGAMLQIGRTTEVYLNISESYRGLRYDDLANPDRVLVAEDALDASRGMNYEIGLRSSPVEGLVFDISLFRIDFNDRIEERRIGLGGDERQRVNSGDSRHQGLEFSVEYDLFAGRQNGSSLITFFNGSLLDAEIRRSDIGLAGNTPSHAPNYLIRTGFIYNDTRLKVALTATLVDDQFWRDDNNPGATGGEQIDARIPSYQVVDLSAEYRFNEQWTLFGGVNNLLDQNYFSRVRSDGVEPAAERTAFAGFRLEF